MRIPNYITKALTFFKIEYIVSTELVLFLPHLQSFVHIILLEGPKVMFCLVSKHDQLCLFMVIVECSISSNFRLLLSLSSCQLGVFLKIIVEWVSDLYFFTVVPRFFYQLVYGIVDV